MIQQGWLELDGSALFAALAAGARTARGRQKVKDKADLGSVEAVRATLDRVGAILRWEETWGDLPVAGVEDVGGAVDRAARGGLLDAVTIRDVGRTLEALDHLAARLAERADVVPELAGAQPELVVSPALRQRLGGSFDETGALSARMYPELGGYRGRIAELHREIRETLESLLRDDGLADSLQDRFVTQRGDRYVLPIKASADRRSVGIVHDVSNRGQTVFVEPHEVVERNNALRLAEAALEEAERRILQSLSAAVGREAVGIERALRAAAALDADRARADLSRRLGGTRPEVGSTGRVRLRQARHPLLALSDEAVVPNDIVLDDAHPVLVVSGPNTGGKTIVLKTLALCAVLVRWGVYVPAAEGSRVDRFGTIHGVLGDRQDVEDHASTFSGHVAALSRLLEGGPGPVLGLIDEIASGTDPAQGAALAIAVIEAARRTGSRLLVTTHLSRVKTWALADDAAQVAGMAFVDGRPTFRMRVGVHGDSHALAVARARGLPGPVVDRAAALLADGDRDLAAALAALDEEHGRAEKAREELEALRASMAEAESRLAAREADIAARARALEAERADGFRDRVAAAEQAIAAVVADLQRAPDHAGVARAKQTVGALKRLAPARPVPPEPDPPAALAEGDRVRLTALGGMGTVVAVGRQLKVQTDRGLTVQVKRSHVARVASEDRPAPARRPSRPARAPAVDLDQVIAHAGNSLDLRGQRVDEGLASLERFLDRVVSDDEGAVFVLHGHGTGAMKQAVREALRTSPVVARWQPAHADQGGDAWTVAAVRPLR